MVQSLSLSTLATCGKIPNQKIPSWMTPFEPFNRSQITSASGRHLVCWNHSVHSFFLIGYPYVSRRGGFKAKAAWMFRGGDQGLDASSEHSENANEDILMFFFQLDLATRVQYALNMEQYDAAQQLRNKLTEVEEEVIKQQQSKRGLSSKSEAQDKALSIIRLRSDLQNAVEKENYALAAELRDEISKLEAESLAASAKALAHENAQYAFRLGQKVRHKKFGYRAVICGMDPVCSETSSWMDNAQVKKLTRGSTQPFYQVEELEKQVMKQREVGVIYKRRMERTQDYLRYCLQTAQENGILDLILSCNGEFQPSPLSLHSITSPQAHAHAHHHPNLALIIHQAKTNGWYIHPNEIKLEQKIGEGSTAEIHRGTWRGFEVAVKCISQDFFRTNENGVVYFSQELETLSRQRHRFVLQLMGACIEPPHHAWVVTEYLSTTLKEWLHGPGNRRRERIAPLPPLHERVGRALEIAQAMQYLHEQKPKLVHRDLKPSNIFLDDALHVRVADFGHARFLGDEEMALTGETGTYVYMAPEVIRCEPYNESCDVYSFGIILNELLTGNYPYVETEYGPTKIAMEVVEGKLRPKLPCDDDVDKLGELIHLICLCWDSNPTTRPSFATITLSLKAYVKNNLI